MAILLRRIIRHTATILYLLLSRFPLKQSNQLHKHKFSLPSLYQQDKLLPRSRLLLFQPALQQHRWKIPVVRRAEEEKELEVEKEVVVIKEGFFQEPLAQWLLWQLVILLPLLLAWLLTWLLPRLLVFLLPRLLVRGPASIPTAGPAAAPVTTPAAISAVGLTAAPTAGFALAPAASPGAALIDSPAAAPASFLAPDVQEFSSRTLENNEGGIEEQEAHIQQRARKKARTRNMNQYEKPVLIRECCEHADEYRALK